MSTLRRLLPILTLGLIQAALGAMIVLSTSIFNRVAVVELGLPAAIPAALVMLHYLTQLARPRLGFAADAAGRCRPLIGIGLSLLAVGTMAAAQALALEHAQPLVAAAVATSAFLLIGVGVSSAGTALLTLLARRVDAKERSLAAVIVWIMMVAGFVITTVMVGARLDPYSSQRLVAVACGVSGLAWLVGLAALLAVKEPEDAAPDTRQRARAPHFRQALRMALDDPLTRRFAFFIFLAMLAYSAEELLLDPFAGTVFGYTPGQSTQLSSALHGGVMIGMLLVVVVGQRLQRARTRSPARALVAGTLVSAAALALLALAASIGLSWPLRQTVFCLGLGNGIFAVSALVMMMKLATDSGTRLAGTRMGVWGASQALAYAVGGLSGASLADVAGHLGLSHAGAYALVFTLEGACFVAAALCAMRLFPRQVDSARADHPPVALLSR